MRTLFGVGLVIVCLGLAGCSVFGKKNSTADASSRNGSGSGGTARIDMPIEPSGPSPGANGLLAGQVQDLDSRRRPGGMIQVVDLQDPKGAAGRIEVEADRNGYFTIQGLQPGHHYQLIARVKDGDRLLSGTTVVTPPNPRMSIVVSEDFTTPATPGLPNTTPLPDRSKTPKPAGPAAQIQSPRVDEDVVPKPPAESSIYVKDPSKIGAGSGLPKPPAASMDYVPGAPSYVTPPPKPVPAPPPHSNDDDPLLPKVGPGADGRQRDTGRDIVPAALTPIPSCVLVGNKLDNFALYDLEGQPWEFKRDRRGRLTVVDFWQSSCAPCLKTVEVLVELQKKYGPAGLEIVGIAYEPGDRDKQVANVRATRGRYSINYLTLLGAGEHCPVAQQFKVEFYPTLVLIDESGQVVWRDTGYDPKKLAELEFEINKRLERRR